MAKLKSFVKLEGTLDGLTFYQKDGQSFVKTKSGVSRNRILKDRAFKRTRENMREFGGAARASKAFRDGYANIIKLMGDTYLSGRLTAVMRRIADLGTGIRGRRSIDIASNTELLNNFEFNKTRPLGAVFYPKYTAPSFDANRDIATWTVPDFETDSFVSPPEGATHFKLVLAAGLVSNYEFVVALDGYEPVEPAENSLGTTVYSDAIPLQGAVGSDTTLVADLGLGTALPVAVVATAAIGIVFYQEINSELYELSSGNTMRVATIV